MDDKRTADLPWMALGAIALIVGATWVGSRARQGSIDERTRARLQPRAAGPGER